MTVNHQHFSSTSNLLDRYSRNARLYPALLVVIPIAACVISVANVQFSWIKALETAAVAVGGTYLLAQLARDPGKERERVLFEKWGGKPSIAILRHSDTRIDAITKSRYHSRLCALVPGTVAPTVESEFANTSVADASYVAWSSHLRNSTRDQKRFPLVFEELVAYGYRRNLFGLRPIGIAVCAICVLVTAAMVVLTLRAGTPVPSAIWTAAIVELFLLIFWIFRVSENWVRSSAECYAARLVDAIDDLYNALHASVGPPKLPRSKGKSRQKLQPGQDTASM